MGVKSRGKNLGDDGHRPMECEKLEDKLCGGY